MANDHWNTPGWLLELVRLIHPIGVDPCSNPTSIVGARFECHGPDTANGFDGLREKWHRLACGNGEAAWVNPPYSKPAPWVAKARIEGRKMPVFLLVNADTSTGWFHDDIVNRRMNNASALAFFNVRLKFSDPRRGIVATSQWPSLLAYWGPRVDRFAQLFRPHAWIVRLPQNHNGDND